VRLNCRSRHILKLIAFVCNRANDGLTEKEISAYVGHPPDEFDMELVSFCIEFALENKWIVKPDNCDRYFMTESGREFLSSQLGDSL
jgi:hypothetical protein